MFSNRVSKVLGRKWKWSSCTDDYPTSKYKASLPKEHKYWHLLLSFNALLWQFPMWCSRWSNVLVMCHGNRNHWTFLLHCPLYADQRKTLFQSTDAIWASDGARGAWERTVQFLFGCSDLCLNRKEQNQGKSATFDFIADTGRKLWLNLCCGYVTFHCVFYTIVSSWCFYYDLYGFRWRCFQMWFYSGEFNVDDILAQTRPY